jgi:hypothetical protein
MPNTFYKTGAARQHALPMPVRVEDYVGPDNVVRAVDA